MVKHHLFLYANGVKKCFGSLSLHVKNCWKLAACVFPSLLFVDGPGFSVCAQQALSPYWRPARWRTGRCPSMVGSTPGLVSSGSGFPCAQEKPREGSCPLMHSQELTQCHKQVAHDSEIDPCCVLDSFLPLGFVCMVMMFDLKSCKKKTNKHTFH